MPASGYFYVRVQELQRPEVVHNVKVRWYSSIKDLKDQLHLITHEPPSTQHIFHSSNPTEFRNSSTLQSIGIDQSGFTLQVAFDDYVRAPFYLEPVKRDLLDEPGAQLLEEVRQGLMRDKTPKVTDELDGSGGSYFLRSQKGYYAAVFKPHDEEQGMPNNPKGYHGVGNTGLRDYFRPGQGCLREVAAYILDYGNFCGVPPTALVHCQHPSFCYPSTTGKRKLFPKLGSLQRFIRSSECFDDIGPSMFSDFEIQKIALLDLRLLNCDRNAANMLVRYKRHESTSSDGTASNDDYAATTTSSTDKECVDWLHSTSPMTDAQDLYEILPIDHGYCMPSKLRINEYDLAWMSLPQVKREVHPAIKEYVATLDFESMLYDVLEQISLPGNSIFLLALAHLLIVQGIVSGLTLYEIATLVARLDDEQASKLEQAIEEAEENAFRAIEMKSQRIPTSASLQNASHHSQPQNMKNVGEGISPLQNKSSSRNSPSNDMEYISLVSTSSSLSMSSSLTDLKLEGGTSTPDRVMPSVSGEENTEHGKVKHNNAVENGRSQHSNLTIGTDGVWDIKSIAACASPLTSVLPAISPHIVQHNSSVPLGHLALPKSKDPGQNSGPGSFSVSISTQGHPIQRSCPLELGSDFLSDLIIAACNVDCEVTVSSPHKLSPLVSDIDKINVTKMVRSPVSKKDSARTIIAGYLAPIAEEKRVRGESTGSVCSSTDNNHSESVVSAAIPTNDPMSRPIECGDGDRNNGQYRPFADGSLGEDLKRKPRSCYEDGSDVVYRSVDLLSPPPLLPKASLLTSPKFLSALSDMHGAQSFNSGGVSTNILATYPLMGTELSRLRSVGPTSNGPRSTADFTISQLDNNLNDSVLSTENEPTFEGVGAGFNIDIDYEGKDIDLRVGSRRSDDICVDHADHGTSNINKHAGSGNINFPDLYSPLSRLLAVPSDPNLSVTILETCMKAGENNKEPIEQPSLRKLPQETDEIGENPTQDTTNVAYTMIATKTVGSDSPLRKRKHDTFKSECGGTTVKRDIYRPYSTPSPPSRTADNESDLGSKSATQEGEMAWNGSNEAHSNVSVSDYIELSVAPGMARVASFSGFESAPIYNFHSEGRFGCLRQEKRKTIMKTPEFNKFRLHFAHEAVLSIITRLLKQKETRQKY